MDYTAIKDREEWLTIVERFKDRLYNVVVHMLGKKDGNEFRDGLDMKDDSKVSQILFRAYLNLPEEYDLYSEEVLLTELCKYAYLVG